MRAEIENGEVVFRSVGKGIVYRMGQGVYAADGAVLDGQAADVHACTDQRRTDDMQVAGNGVSQIGHGNKIVAGDQQRTGLTKRKNGQRYKQQNNQ